MLCDNCGNVEEFVLSIECSVVCRSSEFVEHDWRLSAQCRLCSSDDVTGSPAVLLARHCR